MNFLNNYNPENNLLKKALENLSRADENLKKAQMVFEIGLAIKVPYKENQYENAFSGKFEDTEP